MSTLAARIAEPGIYEMSDEDYLADPVIEPSLNNSTAKILVGQSPLHAWSAHPRLGRPLDADDGSTEAQDFGHVAHQMFLHGETRIRVLNVTDFRTNKAREMRDAAIADGCIPLKADRYEAVSRVVEELARFRLRTGAFTQGKAEQTLVWREGIEWARGKVDWLPDEPEAYLWDLKTVSGLADTQTWSRSAYNFGYDMQSVYYCRGAECVRGEPPMGMKFCVVETKPPYGIRVFEFSPAAIEDAYEQVTHAIALWARCRETAIWPGYSDETEFLDPPPWIVRDRAWKRQQGQALLRPAAGEALIDQMVKSGNLGG